MSSVVWIESVESAETVGAMRDMRLCTAFSLNAAHSPSHVSRHRSSFARLLHSYRVSERATVGNRAEPCVSNTRFKASALVLTSAACRLQFHRRPSDPSLRVRMMLSAPLLRRFVCCFPHVCWPDCGMRAVVSLAAYGLSQRAVCPVRLSVKRVVPFVVAVAELLCGCAWRSSTCPVAGGARRASLLVASRLR